MAELIPLRDPSRSAAKDLPDGIGADGENLGAVVALNLRRLRNRRGHSLERLAKLSGVSRAMLSQIELGRSVPTINVVFKIARAFKVPFSALLVAQDGQKARVLSVAESKVLTSASGDFSTRALFPFDTDRKAEFYELRLVPGGVEDADAHASGTVENLVVVRGILEIEIADERSRLVPGDAILFHADLPHSYRNLADHEALIYLVMTYVDTGD